MTESPYRSGLIAVVGRPNVGKSTLVNAIVGSKVSIVSPKPQTTRHRILGILSREDGQLVFVDTPGLHDKARNVMNRSMNRVSVASMADADVVLVVVEALAFRAEDRDVLRRLQKLQAPIVLVINKIDRVKDKRKLLPFIAELESGFDFAALIPVSALRGTQLQELVEVLLGLLPEAPALYPTDMYTDRDTRFRIAEIIREKLMRRLEEEVPYGIAVEVESVRKEDTRLLIHAVIWVERPGQKAIVIGKQGRMLRQVGRAARLELRDTLGEPVHLELWVKVRENWADNERALRQLGHDVK